MTGRFAHLSQRLFNTPVAIKQDKAEVIMAALAERLGVAQLTRLDGTPIRPMAFGAWDDEYEADTRRGRVIDPGYDMVGDTPIAMIGVQGTLVQKLGTLRPYSGMTGYDGLRQSILTAHADPAVEAIVLDIDSPGGEVAGCFDLVDTIYALRGDKPIWAILSESAYSAAYAIASAADRIIVPRTGGVGSIGVITMHVDWSKALTAAGVAVTFITYGDRKTDFHPEIPLSPEALAAARADINTMGELFVNTVARNRNLAPDAVRETQAACFMGENGVGRGLADAVMAPDAALLALLDELA
ncbi:S49 family peptidase [Burkholderia sp. BCCIQ04A]|uniref:S49 family peptidase n=1 Tax=Burkholderia anthinoferrum TaxID=3090833 RepID=A0ABU5WPC4_9BURK|nr:S49 family peptidase [Burkholderia anthinoferrum]MEB2504633.1 S49 family peptidase [Burkholderia anthinoferrum]MEB2530301.1 S49 family peptidase [Burkholderia anthinoferrum]MEB2561674.1 S49 family peptidase [Burkholderia anthinoferrum]MEB2580575.1 S49 family peptidase [Burkholderia anthinoferrum]MEB2634446.1 S49 family peptidase [Burkholderia anthinoferrum]